MKRLELKRKTNVLWDTIIGAAMMIATSLLLTGCGTGQTTSSSETYTPEVQYQLTNDCALIHVYRPSSMMGAAMSYTLHLNEWEIFQVKNKSKTTVKLTSPGQYTLWAKTESREEIVLNIELGREYYIRCGIGMGVLVGRPKFEYVEPKIGKPEFDKIPWKK